MEHSESSPPKVFISYSHDSPDHESRVLALSNRLRDDGIDATVDQYQSFPPQGWIQWMDQQVLAARFVLVVCTETYSRRAAGEETPGAGLGAMHESRLIQQLLYNTGGVNEKFIPVLLTRDDRAHIPIGLQSYTHYLLSDNAGYEELYRLLTNQPKVKQPVLGRLRALPPQTPKADFRHFLWSVPARSNQEPFAYRDRMSLLKRVRLDWIDGVLKHSLSEIARIELALDLKPDRVLNAIVNVPDCRSSPVSPGTSILQIFDEHAGALLILGAPGTGKTTLLLELAEQLLDRAEQNQGDPIPVVFNLSSWGTRHRDLGQWLSTELYERSDVPKRLAQQLIEAEQIIPLLDGLDEVGSDYRLACVEAINEFRRDDRGWRLPIAICSRIAEYEDLGTKLRLRNAVVVQSLTKVTVRSFLENVGDRVQALRAAVEEDPILLELIETPLMLWIAILGYSSFRELEDSASGTLENRREHLFSTYVDSMFRRRAPQSCCTREETLRWLASLASTMVRLNQSAFRLEGLNRLLLPTRSQRALLRLFVATVHGLIFGLSVGLAAGATRGLIFGLLYSTVTMVFGRGGRRPADILAWSWPAAKNGLIPALFGSVYAGYVTAVSVGITGKQTINTPIVALLAGLILGLWWGITIFIQKGLITQEITTRATPNQGTRRSGQNALISGLIMALATVLLLSWSPRLAFSCGLVALAYTGLKNGGSFIVRHWGMRLVLRLYGYAPLQYVRFLDYAAERVFLQKVGGEYVFVHRMLLDYFASRARTADGARAFGIAPDFTAVNLSRVLGFWSAISIVAGTVVGSGLFLVPSVMVRHVSSVKELFLVWIVGGLLSLFGAMTYAELAAALPEAGGEYVYFRAAYGRFWAFLYGCMQCWVIKSSAIAAVAAAFFSYLSAFFPSLQSPALVVPVALGPGGSLLQIQCAQLLGVVLILTLALSNYMGVRLSGNLQVWVTGAKFAIIIGVAAAGLLSGGGDISHFTSPIHNIGSKAEYLHIQGFGNCTEFLTALVIALWSYDGWNNLTMISSEIKAPHRTLPRALILGMVAVIATYLLVNLSYFYVLSPDQVASSTHVASDMMAKLYGDHGRRAVAVAALISLFATLNGSILSSSRVLYATARDGLYGYIRAAGRVQRRYRTPGNSILLLCLWSSYYLLSGRYEQLYAYVMFGICISYVMTAVSLIVLRMKRPDLERPYSVVGYPFVPLVFIGTMVLLLVSTIQSLPRESLMGLVLTLLAVPFYFFLSTSKWHADEQDGESYE